MTAEERSGLVEINPRAFFRILYRQYLVLGAVVCTAVLLAIIYLHVATLRYMATLELAPVTSQSSLGGNLSALGAIAGISLGKGGASSFKLFTIGLQSYRAAEGLAKDQDLMHRMFPAEWSQSEHRWKEPNSILRMGVHGLKAILGFTNVPWQPPGADRVYQFLQSSIEVDESHDRPTIKLRLLTANPQLGVAILSKLNNVVDNQLRERALERANGYIAYLTHQLSSETVTEYRQTLLDNLSEQEKMKMMANSDVSYVSEVFSGPVVSDKPEWPKPTFIIMFGMVMGLLFGSIAALVAEWQGIRFEIGPRFTIRRDHKTHDHEYA